MTSTAAPDLAREALAAPALRRSLAAMVRRRVPKDDAEDVAQTILCDALAAPSIPSDPEDLRRFVAGIARHKVADFHRRSRRVGHGEQGGHRDLASEEHELSVEPAPIEARAILSSIASSVASSDREQQTLEWLVREHAGEQLQTIAADEGLPAPAVRQRVSRLRRVLRAQWAHARLLVLVAGSCAAIANRAQQAGEHAPIAADPTGDAVAETALLLNGDWRIERIERIDAASDDASAVLEAKVVDIRIRGRRVQLVTPAHTVTRTISAATRHADGSIAIELQSESRSTQHLTAKIDGAHMHVALVDGAMRGSADLVRR
jgi:DNA-directed RNA polymerase specialized sigma24 family protein